MASGAHKLIPSDPEKVMVIRHVTPEIMTLSTPFLRFGRIKVGGRGTVVRLASGSTAVFSPVALTASVKKEVQAMGPTKYIVATDQEHHIFLEEWHKEFPEARVIGPDSLPEYRQKQSYFQIPAANWLSATKSAKVSVDADFDKEFDVEYVSSHANKELVFNHRPSRTLIEADLVFNLPATEQFSKSGSPATGGFLTDLFVGIQNTTNPTWQRRFLWYLAGSSDRTAFNKSITEIASWDFDRIIPCHGDVIETGGKGVFDKVMQWHLDAAKKQH